MTAAGEEPRAVRGRPIRVVAFVGPYPETGAREFLARLDTHPEIEFVGGFCQQRYPGRCSRLRDLWERRRALAPAVVLTEMVRAGFRFARDPRRALWLWREAAGPLRRVRAVPDVHAAEVLEQVKAWRPDLGAIYGAPILRPELFQIPRLGTLGIHHGTLPAYRGKKTTFWEMFHGEETAGVTIQRINEGLDTGEVVLEASVPVAGKGYGRVLREVEEVGVDIYLQAILQFKEGAAAPRPQRGEKGPLYRDPKAADLLRFWWRRLTRDPRAGSSS